MKLADGVFVADLHLREKIPIARTDKYFPAMWDKFKFINSLAKEHDCPVFCSGDFFNHWKPTPELLSTTINAMTANWLTIYGDHDLPNHSLKLKHKSGLTTLEKAGKITIIKGGHGDNKSNSKLPKRTRPVLLKIKDKLILRKIMMWHILTWHKELPYPGCEVSNAKQLLKKYPQYDCILTGDNHLSFVVKYKGRLLVNPGSMMRNNADQINYKPAVWLYYAKTNTVKPVYLPIEKGVISREHIEIKNQRNERIDAFVSKLKTDFKLTMDFKQNVIRFFGKNKTKKKVKKIILNHMENE